MPHLLLATDADWIRDDVLGALHDGETGFTVVRAGAQVVAQMHERLPDLVILDLQIGNMGGMAACMAVRQEEGGGRLPRVPVLMLLDRVADVFLAQRSDADGWLLKPLDSLRLRKAVTAILGGGRYTEGVPVAAGDGFSGGGADDVASPEEVAAPAAG